MKTTEDENNTNMYLNFGVWQDIEAFLIIERKVSSDKKSTDALKSRYKAMCNVFSTTPFTRGNFNNFLNTMRSNGYKNAYLNKFVALAKNLDRYHKLNIFQDYTYFKEKSQIFVDILTPEDIKHIAECKMTYRIDSDTINHFYKTFYYFLGTTGCRIGEAIGLDWNDYHGEYAVFRNTKNGDDRVVPIPKFVQLLIDTMPRGTGVIFNRKDSAIKEDLRKRVQQTGIKKHVSPHTFRHSFISTMIKTSQASLVQIAKIVGHRDLSTTSNVYTHLLIEDLKMTQMLHPLCRKEQSVGDITSSLKRLLDQILDKSKYSLTLIEDNDNVELQIKKT